MRITPVDRWIVHPTQRFINNSTTSGIVLFSSALLAIIISNSPWADAFHHFWELHFTIGFDSYEITKSLHHWINDGLMAIFFFVVGLELKREIIGGELRNPQNAILPISAAIGGMICPALIYLIFNPEGATTSGWGIPMATDIAFALGVLFLLGDKVPLSLKIFLTALAIVDDIGAVLVIAFFYTSDISFVSLGTGIFFMIVLIISNLIGVRSTVYYAIIGIGGLWLAFLMSGVHATIAAVLAAMTIPADVKISEINYIKKMNLLINMFDHAEPNDNTTVTNKQLSIVDDIIIYSKEALTPLQRLEHAMHPFVAFVILPIFAFSNAGVTFSGDIFAQMSSPIFSGVFFGLIFGKVIGVFGLVMILLKFGWVRLPEGMNQLHLLGAGFLASIGFTMSIFIGGLAFKDATYIFEAKMGVLFASIIASVVGYQIIKYANKHGRDPYDHKISLKD